MWRSAFKMARWLAAATAALALTACGSLPRETYTAHELTRAAPEGFSDVRFNADDREATLAFAKTASEELQAHAFKNMDVLALSGGGANGAYGAGVIVGWTATGHRPDFAIVTGVSTGALTAPFAFLGPAWDPRLKHAYTSGAANNLLQSKWLSALYTPGIFSPRPLETLVNAYVDRPLLRAVAAEHAKGRRLLIATTNLDSQKAVIWDMGAIASRGDDKALQLFRKVLVASASIPGVFPPAMIELDGADRRRFREMHVDGGATAPFISVPDSMLLWTGEQDDPTHGDFYILVNGKLQASFGITRRNTLAILSRSYDTMSKSTTRVFIAANRAWAQRNGMKLYTTAIPDDVTAEGFNFDSRSMTELFNIGFERARNGTAWTSPQPDAP